MALDGFEVIALVQRLAEAGGRSEARVARLMSLMPIEARVVARLAGGGHVTCRELEAELDLSTGGAKALARRLDEDALSRREPDPDDLSVARRRLSEGARLEVTAAVGPLAGRLDTLAAGLTSDQREATAGYLARAVEIFEEAIAEPPVRRLRVVSDAVN